MRFYNIIDNDIECIVRKSLPFGRRGKIWRQEKDKF